MAMIRCAYSVLWTSPSGSGSVLLYGTIRAVREAALALYPDAEIEEVRPVDDECQASDARRVIRALRRGRNLGVLVDHRVTVPSRKIAQDVR